LVITFCGNAQAQMPGYPMPGAPAYGQFPGRPTNFADPMPMAPGAAPAAAPGGALGADMMANPMNGAPAHPEALSGADGSFNGQDCYGSCGPGAIRAANRYGYIQVDALYWRREHGWHVNLVNASLDPNVNFINGSNLNYRFEALPRLTGGFVLGNGVAIEGTYFYKDDFSVRKGVAGTANIDITAFGTPIAGSTFSAADWGSVSASTKLQNVEINLVETERFFNFLAGFRYLELQEQTILFAAGQDVGSVDLKTYNRLLGGQAGVRVAHDWGLFGLQAQGKAGMYFNDGSSSTTSVDPGLVYNFNRNAGGQNESFLGELTLMATFRTLSSWQYRLGYNAMWITQVALATDQITNNANTGLGLNARSDLFVHGPYAGAEFRW
jgi:hypothetical protein